MDYTPKQLSFDADARHSLSEGIRKISKAVKSTLGPRGKTVIIESQHHTRGITVTKDGVTVAKSIDLLHPIENLAVRMVKEAADRTATTAGDGTTTAIVLTEAIATRGMSLIGDEVNATSVIRHINTMSADCIERLTKRARKVTASRLKDVAAISANNDPVIGAIIAKAYKEVGENGLVTVEKSMSEDTYCEVTDGIRVERGYANKLFVNNQKKDECILEDVYILLSDHEISNVLSVESILKPIISQQHKLLIIAPCTGNVINTLAANVIKNGLKVCVIEPPQFGYKQHELMSDIAVSVGGRFISESMGDDLSLLTMADLGKAEKVIIGKDNTVIVRNDGTSEEVTERVKELWEAHDASTKASDRDFIKQRIASLTGGIGIIYVGGNSDIEQKETYDRVDDAVCAVRSALEEGILPGGGLALWQEASAYYAMQHEPSLSVEERIASAIMGHALSAPLTQILDNAGLDVEEIMFNIEDGENHGYDVKGLRYGDMYKMGIIDPLKVTKNALKNAVSVATTILGTNAVVTLARAYENE
jgi:chaperonin GroEL